MSKIVLELTEADYKNLIVFLSRVTLQGNEVPAYVALQNALIENSKNEAKA